MIEWAIGIIAVFLAAVCYVAPPAAQKYLTKNGESVIGRKVVVKNVDANLFKGRMAVEGLTVYEVDGTTPFVQADRISADVSMRDLLKGEVRVSSAELDGFQCSLRKDGEKMNVDDLVARFSGDKDRKSRKLDVYLALVNISNSSFRYQDSNTGRKLDISGMKAEVRDLDLAGETPVRAALDFRLFGHGHVKSELSYVMRDSLLDAKVEIGSLPLGDLRPYLGKNYDIGSLEGRLDADLRLEGVPRNLASLRTSGTLTADGLNVSGADGMKLLSFDNMSLDVKLLDMDSGIYRFGDMSLSGLEVYFHKFADRNTNIRRLRNLPPPSDSAQIEEGKAPRDGRTSDFTFGDLSVTGADIHICDESLEKTFTGELEDLNLYLRNFPHENRRDVRLRAFFNKAQIDGQWTSTMQKGGDQHIEFRLANADARDFSPYCEHYTAYPIEKGVISFTSVNSISGSRLESKNEIDAHGLAVGKKNKNVAVKSNIPLKTALYALNDRNGHMTLDIPVNGDLSNPKFHYTKTLFNSLGRLLVKVAARPFSSRTTIDEDLDGGLFVEFDKNQERFNTVQIFKLLLIKDRLAKDNCSDIHVVQYFHLPSGDASHQEQALKMAEERNRIIARRLGIAPERVSTASVDELLVYAETPRFVIYANGDEGF